VAGDGDDPKKDEGQAMCPPVHEKVRQDHWKIHSPIRSFSSSSSRSEHLSRFTFNTQLKIATRCGIALFTTAPEAGRNG
jgi:hypothetical protein